MIEDLCRNIYNIGAELKCGLPAISCLCPDKSAYEYLCYQCNRMQQDITREDYELTFSYLSGEIQITHAFVKEFECAVEDWNGYNIINVVADNAYDEISNIAKWCNSDKEISIELVAMAMTQAALFRTRKVSYINLVNAFKTDQFIDYFWNLMSALMKRMKEGKDSSRLWDELGRCFDNLQMIYEMRDKIGQQLNHYINQICIGLEQTKHRLRQWESFIQTEQDFICMKRNSRDLPEFMFRSIDIDRKIVEYEPQNSTRRDLVRMCRVLKEYLANYQMQKQRVNEDTYNKLMLGLGSFAAGDTSDIDSITELKGIDLKSDCAWRANADIIYKYLDKIRRRNCVSKYMANKP